MSRPGRVARVRAVVLVVLALLALLAGCSEEEAPAFGPPAAAGDRAACERFVAALPEAVADQPRSDLQPPDGVLGAAWGDPAIVLTCGVPDPAGLTDVSTCTTVDGVDWFTPEEQLDADAATDEPVTMTTLNREVDVEVVMPRDYWPPAATLSDLSGVVADVLERTGRCR